MKEFYGVVYLVTNLVNGKVYVGQTVKSIRERWSSHVRSSQKDPKVAFQFAIRKYGPSMFAISVVAKARSRDELNMLEREWVATRRANSPQFGYNMTAGGDANPDSFKGRKLPDWHKERLLASTRGKPKSEAHRAALKASWKPRRPMSQETREAMIAKKKARIVSPEERQAHIEAIRRRVLTPELRAKYREAGLKAQRVMRERGQDPVAALMEYGKPHRFKPKSQAIRT